jgi:hypothetical protein
LKAATRNEQIFVFWSSGYDPQLPVSYDFTLPSLKILETERQRSEDF